MHAVSKHEIVLFRRIRKVQLLEARDVQMAERLNDEGLEEDTESRRAARHHVKRERAPLHRDGGQRIQSRKEARSLQIEIRMPPSFREIVLRLSEVLARDAHGDVEPTLVHHAPASLDARAHQPGIHLRRKTRPEARHAERERAQLPVHLRECEEPAHVAAAREAQHFPRISSGRRVSKSRPNFALTRVVVGSMAARMSVAPPFMTSKSAITDLSWYAASRTCRYRSIPWTSRLETASLRGAIS